MKRKFLVCVTLLSLGLALALARKPLDGARPAQARAVPAAAVAAAAASSRDRCGTKQIDETIATQYESSLKNFNSRRSPGQIRKSGSVTIGVYFHVVNKGAGVENGDVPLKWLNAQINVLNAAYAGADPSSAATSANTPFRFALVGVDRTTNAAWFNGCFPDSAIESEMKSALRRGGSAEIGRAHV